MIASPPAAASEPFETFMTGGVIRNDGSGWEVLDDRSHKPLRIKEVVTTPRYIEVRQEGGAYTVSAIVTVDEALAAEGYTVGLSGGKQIMRFFMYKDGELVDPRTVTTETVPMSNLWFLTIQGR